MDKKAIGTNAGIIWNLLNNSEKWDVSQLMEKSGLTEIEVYTAIGWLARENKIEIEDIAISTPKKEDVEDPILNGRVEYFNQDKGYGFIKHTGSTEKYFFHVSSTLVPIEEGNMVTFDLERGQKGMNAVRITLANKDDQK